MNWFKGQYFFLSSVSRKAKEEPYERKEIKEEPLQQDNICHTCDVTGDTVRDLEEKLRQITEERDRLKEGEIHNYEELAKTCQIVDKLNEQLGGKDTKINEMKTQLAEMQSKVNNQKTNLQNQQKTSKNEISELGLKLKDADRQIATLNLTLTRLTQDNSTIKQEKHHIEKKLENAEVEAIEKGNIINRLREEKRQLQDEKEELANRWEYTGIHDLICFKSFSLKLHIDGCKC